jgi:hypothetical protein
VSAGRSVDSTSASRSRAKARHDSKSELSDLDETEIGELRSHEHELAMLLSEDDVKAVAAAVEPGSTAGVLVWENSWAAPFASAVRHSGGQLVASGRIPIQALVAAVEADETDEREGA